MKKFDAILFDLDGTLIHMPQERFTRGTTALMAQTCAKKLGLDEQTFIKVLWDGMGAMIANDGKATNGEVFYRATGKVFSDRVFTERCFEEYYKNEFNTLKAITTENPNAAAAVAEAHRLADRVILATLPVFPFEAQKARLNWIGLTHNDFDLVTDLDNSHFCKPSTCYYREIADKFRLDPVRTMMVGNDLSDDILPAQKLGMQSYIVTDWLLNGQLDAPGALRSTFAEFTAYLRSL